MTVVLVSFIITHHVLKDMLTELVSDDDSTGGHGTEFLDFPLTCEVAHCLTHTCSNSRNGITFEEP